MRRITRDRWGAFLCAAAAASIVAALALAGPHHRESVGAPPDWLLGSTAIFAALFAAAIAVIAWQAGEWSPAFLALGCVGMGEAAVLRGLMAADVIPGGSEGSLDAVNAAGMLAGGLWFAVGARPRWPTGPENAGTVRLLILSGSLLGVVVVVFAARVPTPWMDEPGSAVIGAAAAAGYVLAAFAFASAFRFLRLPSQFWMTAGTAALAGITVLAAQGLAPLTATTLELLAVLASALPPAAFLLEQRARPGLRTMVLSLSVSGAVEHFKRGHPEAVLQLLEEVAGYDEHLAGHLDRVARLSVRLGQELGLGLAELGCVAQAAQLHDVGKIFVPRHILNSPGKISGSDWEIMRSHAAEGERIVARIPAAARAAGAVGEHHERWDGSGYPRGLSRTDISLVGRIVAVADVFDALCSARSYKAAWSQAEALAEVRAASGSHFDPAVVAALETLVERAIVVPLAA